MKEKSQSTTGHGKENLLGAMLRVYFLSRALPASKGVGSSVSRKGTESLRSDLEELETLLRRYTGEGLQFSIARRCSVPARNWENFLNEVLDDDSCRWERVLLILQELTALDSDLRVIAENFADLTDEIELHQKRFGGHLVFYEEIMSRWVRFEKQRKNPVERLCEQISIRRNRAWERVLTEFAVREVKSDSQKWQVFEGALQSILGHISSSPVEPPKNAA